MAALQADPGLAGAPTAAPMWPHTTFWARLIAIEPHDAGVPLAWPFDPLTAPSSDSRWLIADEGHIQRTNDLAKDVAARHRRMQGDRGTQVDRVSQRAEAQRPSGPNDRVPARGNGLFQSHQTPVEIPWTCELRQR